MDKKSYDEVAEYVKWLANFGGTQEGGTTRLLYTPEWLAAQQALQSKMELVGMDTHFDAVGNLYGRYVGSKYPNEVIASGSHVDTVINGGKLDGQFGIVAAFLAMKNLVAKHGAPLRTLEAISMAEEEGSRFPFVFWGSKNIWKLAKRQDVEHIQDAKGIKFVDAMRQCGFDFQDRHVPDRRDMKAFVELHIEQGAVLEIEGFQIGVVNNIVGQRRYNVTLKGQSNHAGTTPMKYRRDTIVTFSKICDELTQRARAVGDPLVITFGHLEVKPNTVNVVPGRTLFTIDCRHTDKKILVDFTTEIEKEMKRIAKEADVEIEIDLWMDEDPVPMDGRIVKLLENICEKNKLSYRVMHSGAGHDAQIFAPHVPTAMLFIPSIKGVSHNPAEETQLVDLVEGVKALSMALYELAYKE